MTSLWCWRTPLPWRRAPSGGAADDLSGFELLAPDGPVGRVARACFDRRRSSLVVHLRDDPDQIREVPAAVVDEIDDGDALVRVACSCEQVITGPPYEPDMDTELYRTRLSNHYRPPASVPPRHLWLVGTDARTPAYRLASRLGQR